MKVSARFWMKFYCLEWNKQEAGHQNHGTFFTVDSCQNTGIKPWAARNYVQWKQVEKYKEFQILCLKEGSTSHEQTEEVLKQEEDKFSMD